MSLKDVEAKKERGRASLRLEPAIEGTTIFILLGSAYGRLPATSDLHKYDKNINERFVGLSLCLSCARDTD